MSATFVVQKEFSVDRVSIPTWDINEMKGIEVIQVNESTLRLRAYFDATFSDEYFEDIDDLYEDGCVGDIEIDKIECKVEFQIDFDIRNLRRDGSERSTEFEVLNISDIDYEIPARYASQAVNRSALNKIYDMIEESITDLMYGLGSDDFTMYYSMN